MPRKRVPGKPLPERLGNLPRRAEQTLIGGVRPLPVAYWEQGVAKQVLLVLWLDATAGSVLTFGLVPQDQTQDSGVTEALQLLYRAIEQPFTAPGVLAPPAPPAGLLPALPARILIDDEALARAAGEALAPLGVAVEYAASLPPLDAAFAALGEQLGAEEDAEPPEPFAWGIDPALLLPLYKAAARLYRRAPWHYLPDYPPVVLDVGQHGPCEGVDTLYASILGQAGEVFGVAFYSSAEAIDRIVAHSEAHPLPPLPTVSDEDLGVAVELLRQMGIPVDSMPKEALRPILADAMAQGEVSEGEYDQLRQLTQDSLVVFYEERDEIDPSYLDWIVAHHLPTQSKLAVPSFLAMGEGGEPANPNARETQALTLALEALNQFFSTYGRELATRGTAPQTKSYTANVRMRNSTVPVELTFTPSMPSFAALPDLLRDLAGFSRRAAPPERKPRATKAGRTTLYRFQVKLASQPTVWRRIELRGDQTLADLHAAIQTAFGWDDAHLYAFFLSGKAWDEDTEYVSPLDEEGRSADNYRLEHLPLRAGQRILYIFDFGDELKHTVKLEAIVPGGVEHGVTYPRITERRGENVPQYDGLDDAQEDAQGDEQDDE